MTMGVVGLKYLFHVLGWEIIGQSSLHNGVITSATFVIGFLLSVTIADYKESERVPAEFAANLEDLYDDAAQIHTVHPKFDLEAFRAQLEKIAKSFRSKVRQSTSGVSDTIRVLNKHFADMERAGVPPNFIVKLKQQQGVLMRHRKRITYIQTIQSVPSATILSRSVVLMVIILLILTNVDPFYGSLVIIGIITFGLLYMILLLESISKPFHASGQTQDDVSMFLINDAEDYLRSKKQTRKG